MLGKLRDANLENINNKNHSVNSSSSFISAAAVAPSSLSLSSGIRQHYQTSAGISKFLAEAISISAAGAFPWQVREQFQFIQRKQL